MLVSSEPDTSRLPVSLKPTVLTQPCRRAGRERRAAAQAGPGRSTAARRRARTAGEIRRRGAAGPVARRRGFENGGVHRVWALRGTKWKRATKHFRALPSAT